MSSASGKPLIAAAAAVAVLLASTAARASTDFVIQPFLQHLGTSKVQVRFQTDEEVQAVVELQGPGKSTPKRFQDAEAKEFHDVMVDGLEPSTTYSYVVRAGDQATAPASFTTAPADASKPFTFLIAGDNRDDLDVYAELIQLMVRTPSDFLVHTGDLVPRGKDTDAWEEYFRIAQPLLSTRCEFVAIGNHDFSGKGSGRREPFLRYFASPNNPETTYFTFRWGNTRFFVLDTQETWEADQRPWLKERLENSDHEDGIRHRMVLLHHSPFSTGKHGPNRSMRSAGILHMMLEHRIDLVIGGHDHMYERDQFGGIKYIVSGGGGAPLYDVTPRSTGSAYTASVNHFVEVRVEGDKVTAVARDAKGKEFDSAAFEGTGMWAPVAPPPPVATAAPPPAGGTAVQPLPKRSSSCGCSTPGGERSSLGVAAGGALLVAALWHVARRRPGGGA